VKLILQKIISGGQTGADRAALDAAIDEDFPYGGWCPRGRRSEDGKIPDRYKLREAPTEDYAWRTEKNVLDSSGTVIFLDGSMNGEPGCVLTASLANRHQKPVRIVNFAVRTAEAALPMTLDFLRVDRIVVLNVAGPRASRSLNIYARTYHVMCAVIRQTKEEREESVDA
jgi:hypothetical protein